jgi:asparagine synthase (glutamine-hydrolysing)
VPLGAQLSGGVDSSLIVAKMEELRQRAGTKQKVKTFAIGFDADGFSELPYARQVAERYNTEHHEVIVGFDDFVKEFARLCWVYDEPVSEPAAIPTYLLCRFASQHVKVMLTGEGGDELFGGYPKCAFDQYSRYLNWMPAGLRRSLLRGGASLLPFSKRRARIGLENLAIADEAERLASWFSGFDSVALAQIAQPGALDGVGAAARLREELARCDSQHALDRMLYADLNTWLVDDLLIKGDRMSMASGVEARVPFLDHIFVEYAAGLPPAFKAKGTRTKILLKKLAEKYIPHETIYRRKVGFTVPLTPWFQGPLKSFVREILLSERAMARGYFKPQALTRLVEEHLGGKVDRGRSLWTLLSLEIWHRLFVDDDGTEAAAGRLGERIGNASR